MFGYYSKNNPIFGFNKELFWSIFQIFMLSMMCVDWINQNKLYIYLKKNNFARFCRKSDYYRTILCTKNSVFGG